MLGRPNRSRSPHRPPMVYQSEAHECGLACISMILSAWGRDVTLSSLRAGCEDRTFGIRLSTLLNEARRHGLTARPLRVELDDLDRLPLPALLHWDMDHYVVLVECRAHTCTIHDPARGVLQLTRHEVSQCLTGVVTTFSPASGFSPGVFRSPHSLVSLWRSLPNATGTACTLLFLSLLLQALGLMTPLLMKTVIDRISSPDLPTSIIIFASAMAAVEVLATFIRWLRVSALTSMVMTVRAHLSLAVVNHTLHLPFSFFQRRNSADILSRLESIESVRKQLSEEPAEAVSDLVVLGIAIAFMATQSVLMTTACIVLMAIYVAVLFAFLQPIRMLTQQQLTCASKASGLLTENVHCLQALRLARAIPARIQFWYEELHRSLLASRSLSRLLGWQDGAKRIVLALEQVFSVGIGLLEVRNSHLTLGAFFAVFALRQRVVAQCETLCSRLQQFRLINVHLERMADITQAAREQAGALTPVLQTGPAALSVRNLTFAYPGRPPIMENLTFDLAAGECLLIVGPSGCGKSSLLKVLLGLESASAGEIFLDHLGLQASSDERLLRRVGAVMQSDTAIFNGTLLENISVFEPEADRSLAGRLLDQVGLDGLVSALPQGLDTRLATGAVLSGGQTQRVLLARALYRRPGLLILDEATAHLDAELERHIFALLRRLGISLIVVSHRPGNVQYADKVLQFVDARWCLRDMAASQGAHDSAA